MKKTLLTLAILLLFVTGCGKNPDAITFADSKLEDQLRDELKLKGDILAEDLNSLTELEVAKGVTSVRGLEEATNLVNLDLSNISTDFDYNSLRLLKSLTTLTIKNVEVGNFGFLRSVDGLTNLTLVGCKFEEFRDLRQLSYITNLDLSNNSITSLNNIDDLVSLEKLNLTGNALENIDGLTDLIYLKEVKLDTTVINANPNVVATLKARGVTVLEK